MTMRTGATLRQAAVPLAAIAYALGIFYLAWPISADPSSRVVDLVASGSPLPQWTEADRNLAIWVLGWTARAIVTAPLDVFQANIFYPAPDTLASSENLLGLLPVSAPTFLLTGNPVLTHNLTLFASIWASALLTFLLVRDWTESAAAGFLAGATFAFAPTVTAMWSNVISASAVHFFPLVLFLAIRAARKPRWWTLLGLALAVVLQILAGLYVAYQLAVLVALFAPAVWWEARRRGNHPLPVIALAAGFLVLLPLSRPYVRVRESGVLPDFESARAIASGLGLSIESAWLRILEGVGWPALVLALPGAVLLRRGTAHLRIVLVAAGAVGVLLSLGPSAPLLPNTGLPGLYEIAMHVVPGFSAMRAPGRFLVVPVFCLSLLAGMGAADVVAGLRHWSRTGAMAGGLAVLLLGVGMVVARTPEQPLVATRVPATPADWEPYRWLRAHGDGEAVLELPAMVSPLDLKLLGATGGYLIGATLHGLPLINGYSGHGPPTAELLLSLAQRLPEQEAFEQMCDLVAVGWVVMHLRGDRVAEEAWDAAEQKLGLDRAAEFAGPVRVYRPRRRCGELQDRLLAQLAGDGRDRTLRGTPMDPLDAGGRRGRIDTSVTALPGWLHAWIWVEVTNEGNRTWPGLTLEAPGAVQLQSRFRDLVTGSLRPAAIATPLGVDLEPGKTTRVRVGVQVPPPGEYVLEVGLAQEGRGWFADQPGGGAILRRPVTAVPFGVGRDSPASRSGPPPRS